MTISTSATTRRPARWSVPAGESDRVTNFELFFDLVFVFAITQVTGHITAEHDAVGLVQGAILLGLLWWAWSAYAWLGNQARVDADSVRLGMFVAMVAVFVVALTIPEAWHDRPGGLDAPLVLVIAFLVVRVVHQVLYVAASRGDANLRRQLALNVLPLTAGGVLLVIGAVVGGAAQTAVWGIALAVDWVMTYVTSVVGRGWRIRSVSHWVERHGLIVILALGESVVAIGAGASGEAVDWNLIAGSAVALAVATALWWLYFDAAVDATEHVLERYAPERRVRIAIDAYTYLHYLMILGIVVAAVAIEEVFRRSHDHHGLGGFAAVCLCLGVATYLLAHVLSWVRLDGKLKMPRLIAACIIAALTPLCAAVSPLLALTLVAIALIALVGYENRRYAEFRAGR
jgi:low temperature requirement protein LtrA